MPMPVLVLLLVLMLVGLLLLLLVLMLMLPSWPMAPNGASGDRATEASQQQWNPVPRTPTPPREKPLMHWSYGKW